MLAKLKVGVFLGRPAFFEELLDLCDLGVRCCDGVLSVIAKIAYLLCDLCFAVGLVALEKGIDCDGKFRRDSALGLPPSAR